MSSSSTDDASTASIEASQFLTIHVNKASAVVSWKDDHSQLQYLSHDLSGNDHVTLDLQCETNSNTALFKITTNIAYKGKRNRSNVYLHIYPERIRTLSVTGNDETAAPARLGTTAHTLQFDLFTPAALIIPKGDWVPKNEAAQSTLAAVEALSLQTSFSVAFSSKSIAMVRLVTLCEKASSSGCLKTMSNAANITKLYGGRGGKLVEHAHLIPAAQGYVDRNETAECPPAYGEVGDSPPPHPSQVKKRRRLDSDDGTGDVSREKTSLEDICRQGFADFGRRFDRIEKSLSDLTSRLDQVERLVRENRVGDSSGEADRHPNTLGKRIEDVEARVVDVETKLQVGLSDLAHDVENQMHDVRHEFNDTISVRVDDEVGVAQNQLEDFVKDELRNAAYEVEEVIREKLKDALS